MHLFLPGYNEDDVEGGGEEQVPRNAVLAHAFENNHVEQTHTKMHLSTNIFKHFLVIFLFPLRPISRFLGNRRRRLLRRHYPTPPPFKPRSALDLPGHLNVHNYVGGGGAHL